MKSFLLTTIIGLTAMSVAAADTQIDMSYAKPGAELTAWGTSKKENYEFAMHINNPGIAGSKVLSFSCPIADPAAVTNMRAWLSVALTLDKDGVTVPDVLEVKPVVGNDGVLSVTLSEPYELTRDGVFVGFSFDIENLSNNNTKPLLLAPGSDPEGYWLHTSRTYLKWRTFENRDQALPINVVLSGDFAETSVAVTSVSPSTVGVDDKFDVKVGLSNFGRDEVKTIDYTYTIGDVASGSGSYTLENPIPAVLGSRGEVTLNVGPAGEVGQYPLTITVTKVNGRDNLSNNASAVGDVTSALFVPVNRPLMEEYTGLWCGFCPRGYIGMERMKERYPDRFVAISYHARQRDPLQFVTTMPNNVSGYPGAYLNRSVYCDPYFGTGKDDFGIENDWFELANAPVNADVEAHLGWANEEHTAVNCYGRVRFVTDEEGADYRLSFALIADGITRAKDFGTSKEWRALEQSNYFTGDYSMKGDDWDVFVNGEEKVKITFNDIVIAYDDQTGIVGSVPSHIRAGKYYSYNYQYEVPVKNAFGDEVGIDYSKIRCVAILTNSKGEVVNSCASGYIGTSGIDNVVNKSDSPIVDTIFYNLSGLRVQNPENGLYIRVDRHADGTVSTNKVIL